ncbi:DUF3152 domain-containing protein [Demequina sp.]|uniref:DUF3152 domain-containing protein n=1 Tax=Demequina sp. TaxID=2050685 RepID=UPI0025F6833E|nr:DUF3152 domain-containing protein [Demequina sp.]
MSRRSEGLFAGRGIALPGVGITLLAIAVAFALGIGAGWLTGLAPDIYRSWRAGPDATASPSPSASPSPEVSLPSMGPITRELDEEDAAAGVVTVTIPEMGEGTFTAAPGSTPTTEEGGPVRFVRVDVEDGLTMDEDALVDFVMTNLNDARGWGSAGRQQFVLTDGAADVRIVLASPATAATVCTDSAVTPSPTPTPGASPSPAAVPCPVQGIVPISIYDWTAGLDAFGTNRKGSRIYQLNHGVGLVLGEEVAVCETGLASVMVDQTAMPAECRWNPWPFPLVDAG